MNIPHISPKNASGLVDKIVGLTREVAGTALDNKGMKKAGQIQQEKGTEKLKAVQSELEASKHDSKARAAAGAEKSQQKAKVGS